MIGVMEIHGLNFTISKVEALAYTWLDIFFSLFTFKETVVVIRSTVVCLSYERTAPTTGITL